MNPVEIFVITEGMTERVVGKVLWQERRVLSQDARPRPADWASLVGSREGYEQVIDALKRQNPIAPSYRKTGSARALLIFDQEDSNTPEDRKVRIERDLRANDSSGFWTSVSFQPLDINGLFEYRLDGLHIVLHISYAGQWKDFDGYILQLLQGPAKAEIARALAPQNVNPDELLHKAEQELTEMMNRNGFPWTRAKSWLYAYITVFQFRQSHVWFAEEVVRKAPEGELRRVFAPLIAAWDRLAAFP